MPGKRSATSSARRSTPGPQAMRRSAVAAFRAGLGPPLDMAAMMAHERAAEAMLHQPGRAVGALEAMAAGAAQGQRRIAAAVEKQQRLLAALQRLRRCVATSRGESQWPRGGPAVRMSMAARCGQCPPAEARRQAQVAIASLLGVDPRLDGGRRRRQHHGAVLDPPAHHRHVARVVGDAVLLLVGALVFLIDDDRARDPRNGRKSAERAPATTFASPLRHAGADALALARRQRPNAIRPGARRSVWRNGRETARSARFPASGSAPAAPAARPRPRPRNRPPSCPSR